MGLSGDLPILRVELSEEFDIGELRSVLAAHRLWRWHGAAVDVALVHPGMPGYVEPLRERILDLAARAVGSQELLANGAASISSVATRWTRSAWWPWRARRRCRLPIAGADCRPVGRADLQIRAK